MLTLRQWIVPAVNASFAEGKLDVARGARAFLDWLDSLPVTTDDDHTPDVTDWQDHDHNRWNLH